MTADASPAGGGAPAGRRLPPVAAFDVASMTLVLTGAIYLAANLPGTPSLAPAVGLLAGAGVLALANALLLARLRDFAWSRFFQVGGWVLVAYGIIAGMLEYVFVLDGTRGAPLAVMTLMLVVFALDVALLLGFSVARYESPRASGSRAETSASPLSGGAGAGYS